MPELRCVDGVYLLYSRVHHPHGHSTKPTEIQCDMMVINNNNMMVLVHNKEDCPSIFQHNRIFYFGQNVITKFLVSFTTCILNLHRVRF